MTFFPVARSVQVSKTPPAGIKAETLIQSGPQSWGESDLTSNEVKQDEKDLAGPVPIAAVISKDAAGGKKARLVVFGDSDFPINANFSNQGNGNLFLKS